MTGFLFVICVPRERYEKCMDSAIRITQDDLKSQQHDVGRVSSESSDNSLKIARRNLDNYTTAVGTTATSISIESEINNTNRKQEEDEEPFVQGSMESDVFQRAVEKREREREKEEIIEKFFSTPTRSSIIDKMLTPMEQIMREIIHRMNITNVSWKKINSANFYNISFCIEQGARFDETIHLLSEYGIGQKKGSSIAVVPCTLYDNRRARDKDSESLKESAWEKFLGTVRARLNVAKIVTVVKSDASLSFDFFLLLVVASVLASFGLVENSTLFLAASMLISPLMHPILAATFGAAIKNRGLHFWGLRNEMIGIFMCIFVGFIFGLIINGVDYFFEDTKVLTPEILSRCSIHSVLVGICIALPSGAAQSIALLRENFGSLAGVAISASLLPPAVNTGLLWSFSLLSRAFSHTGHFANFINHEKEDPNEDEATELIILGFISLLVTLTNVFSVYIMGYFFLRLKIKVAPILNEEERQFWKHDVPIARDYNDEMLNFSVSEPENFKGVGRELLRQDFYQHQQTHAWSPMSHRYNHREFDVLYRNVQHHRVDEQHKGAFKKKSEPIATSCIASTSYERHKLGSMDDVCINRHTTLVNILSSSNEDDDEQMQSARKSSASSTDDHFI